MKKLPLGLKLIPVFMLLIGVSHFGFFVAECLLRLRTGGPSFSHIAIGTWPYLLRMLGSAVLGVANFAAGIWLMRLKPLGRKLTIVCMVIFFSGSIRGALTSQPLDVLSVVLCMIILWYLLRPSVKLILRNSAQKTSASLQILLFSIAGLTIFGGLYYLSRVPGRMFYFAVDSEGKETRIVYSDVYETRKILIPNQLAVQIFAKDQKITDLWYGLRQALGALSSEDWYSPAEAWVLIFNRQDAILPVTLTAIQIEGQNILKQPIRWNLKKQGTQSLTIPGLTISSYATSLDCELHATVNEQSLSQTLTLNRLSEDEADNLFEMWNRRKTSMDIFFEESRSAPNNRLSPIFTMQNNW